MLVALFRQLLTGRDNTTHDVARHMGLWSSLFATVFQGWDVIANHAAFNVQNFGIGIAAIITATGAALKLKADTEPETKP